MSAKDNFEKLHISYPSEESTTIDCRLVKDDHDLTSAAVHATKHAGNSDDAKLYSHVVLSLGRIKQSVSRDLDIDEQAAELHEIFFPLVPLPSPPNVDATSSNMGIAAALQALKMLTGFQPGVGNDNYKCLSPITPQGSSNNMNALVGIAMAEASLLFDTLKEFGELSSDANREKAVYEAGKIALQMYLKTNCSSNCGLITLATQFL